MIFPQGFEEKIGFDRIRELLAGFCLFAPGREETKEISFMNDPELILKKLKQAEEFRHILLFEQHFPLQDFYDMTPSLHGLRIPGTYLDPEKLSELKLALSTISGILVFIEEKAELYPELYQMVSRNNEPGEWQLSVFSEVINLITSAIDEKSGIRSSASPELTRIRKETASLEGQVEKKIIGILKQARQSGWTPDGAEVTIRDGRLVIPVQSAHKRKLPGFIHDESATGQTVYLEPAELLELNNDIRELMLAEQREIIRILLAIAGRIRPELDLFLDAFGVLAKIDCVRAKALLSLQVQETPTPPPIITGKDGSLLTRMQWNQAVHPLLYLKFKASGKKVVPLDIVLNPENRILVISGPNAGGKSICLKTVGLLQYMFQCGIIPPVRDDSEFMIFDNIFIDIGDEQSLDNDLSTYSSKLLNLKFFIEHLDRKSLFLVDEMGTGTDPALGGPVAEAALEAMAGTGAYGVVTTHYSNLKLLAGRQAGIVNGAMLYDSKKMKPLFTLKTGKPGSSFALEIARNIGFPDEVLKKAEEKAGRSQLDFDRQLQDLEVEKEDLVKKTTEVHVADNFLNELIIKYQKLSDELEKSKKDILLQAREEAKQLLKDSNRMIEKTIKEIREAAAEKERTREVRGELKDFSEKIAADPEKPAIRPKVVSLKDIKQAETKPAEVYRAPSRFNPIIDELNSKLATYQMTLDVRGKRAEELWGILQRYIDDAVLLSIPEVRILHGKGNGVLRQVTRDYLRTVKEVKRYRDEAVENGGSGITVVEFR